MTGYWSPSAGVGSSWRLKLELPASKLPLPSSTSHLFFFFLLLDVRGEGPPPLSPLNFRFLHSSALRPPLFFSFSFSFPLVPWSPPTFLPPIACAPLLGENSFFPSLSAAPWERFFISKVDNVGIRLVPSSGRLVIQLPITRLLLWFIDGVVDCIPRRRRKNWEKNRVVSWTFHQLNSSMTALTEESTHQEFLTATNYKINLCVIFGCIFLPPNLFCRENIQSRAFGVGGYPEFLTAWKPLLDV